MEISNPYKRQIIERSLKDAGFLLSEDKPFKRVWKKGWITVVVGNYRVWLFENEISKGIYIYKHRNDYEMLKYDLKELLPGISFHKSALENKVFPREK